MAFQVIIPKKSIFQVLALCIILCTFGCKDDEPTPEIKTEVPELLPVDFPVLFGNTSTLVLPDFQYDPQDNDKVKTLQANFNSTKESFEFYIDSLFAVTDQYQQVNKIWDSSSTDYSRNSYRRRINISNDHYIGTYVDSTNTDSIFYYRNEEYDFVEKKGLLFNYAVSQLRDKSSGSLDFDFSSGGEYWDRTDSSIRFGSSSQHLSWNFEINNDGSGSFSKEGQIEEENLEAVWDSDNKITFK